MPRVLLVKLGAIGDVLMVIPAAHAAHAAGYQIDWICGRDIAPMLALYPWINVLEADERSLLLGRQTARLRAVLSLWSRLRSRTGLQPYDRQPYELCATLYYDTRYKLLTLPVRCRRRLALSLTDRASRLLPGRHHSSEYARILLAHLPERTGRGSHSSPVAISQHRVPQNPLPDGESPAQFAPVPISTQLLPPSPLPPAARPRIVLIPAGSRNLLREDTLRRWPIEHYVALARLLRVRSYEVVLAGGPGDEWASAHFAGLATADFLGKLSLLESLALLGSADLVVSHDTGPLHMAALTSAAIVAIFGPTDPRVFLPQRPNTVALWGGEGFACRPCYDGRNFAPCLHNGCMHQVEPAMVVDEIDHLLAARREGRQLLPRIAVPTHTPLHTLTGPPPPHSRPHD
jgi:heptosyltransferase-2